MSAFEILTIILSGVASVISISGFVGLMNKLMKSVKAIGLKPRSRISISIKDSSGHEITVQNISDEDAQRLVEEFIKFSATSTESQSVSVQQQSSEEEKTA